jgi:UDP-4-amino-4,6-dideoxy-N-acetyl-beta-L-altrosamine transaminase
MIPYGRQDISQDDIEAVIEVLRSDSLTQGPKVPEFERALADYTGANYALAVNSATSALHIACLALDLGPGDWLWTTPNTFVASANCAQYCNAKVDFVDIDPDTYNLSATKLAEKLERAEKENRLPKIVIPVHFSGQSCDMKAIHALSQQYGFRIIEDASHAVGGKYLGKSVGCCQFSDITVFSFHPVKIITTAEGGLALTNDQDFATKMALYRSHGVTRDPRLIDEEMDGVWDYKQIALGFNYRMTDLQAALGLSQLTRLDTYVAKRNELAQRYDDLLSESVWITPKQDDHQISARHLYVVRIPNTLSCHKAKIFDFLRDHGVGVNVHYIPVHTQPYYRKKGLDYGDLSTSEDYYKGAISIPLYPNMTLEDQDFIVGTLNRALVEILDEKNRS